MLQEFTKRIFIFTKLLSGSRGRFVAFAIFLTLVFLTGGSSRDDVQSLLILRPLAIVFVAYALVLMPRKSWRGRLFPLYIVLSLLLLMALQLIPLPPSIWADLPGRQIFSDVAKLAGIEQSWRPITLSPSRTLNSLFSLAVPVAAIMLYLNLDKAHRRQSIAVIILLVMLSALLGIFQLMGSSQGPLYFYRISNSGSPVGLFANRNHQAVLLAASILIMGWYAGSQHPNLRFAALKFYGCVAIIFIYIPLIFITGSRAGLLLMVPALLFAMAFIYLDRFSTKAKPHHKANFNDRRRPIFARQAILLAGIVGVVSIVALSVGLSRSLALDRLVGGNKVVELRAELLPILVSMLKDYFPWGSGFGSFEYVYRIYEPHELLNPSYLNHAHNDWLQVPIEGGVIAVLIGLVATIWFVLNLYRLIKYSNALGYKRYSVLMAALSMLVFLAGSVGDYPLRVPSIMSIFVVLACFFGDEVGTIQQRETRTV